MKAVQVVEFNKPYSLLTVPTPSPSPTELLIKIAAASLCHTDFMGLSGVFGVPPPFTASHEGAGTVVKLGSSVKDSAWKIGDRVMCPIVSGRCGTCAECQGPEENRHYCPREDHRGLTKDGAFGEYMLVDADETVLLPDGVSFEVAAPLACAGRTVYRAIKLASLQPGQTICIIGSGGGLGHIGIQFAKNLSLRVIGIDARDTGLALSKEMGADLVLDARKGKEEVVAAIKRFTAPGEKGEVAGAGGADATVNLSDAASAAGLACAVTKMHGVMVQVAQPESVSFPFQEVVFRDVRVRGSLLCSRREAEEMLELVAKGGIEVKKKIVRGLEGVEELVRLTEEGKINGKGVVVL